MDVKYIGTYPWNIQALGQFLLPVSVWGPWFSIIQPFDWEGVAASHSTGFQHPLKQEKSAYNSSVKEIFLKILDIYKKEQDRTYVRSTDNG